MGWGRFDGGGWGGFAPYVSVAERRRKAAAHAAKLAKQGRKVAPVRIAGRAIAKTFWGTAWCENLESYQDYANRLPRGRTYVRNGSVMDLQVFPGRVSALVSGSEIYEIAVTITPLAPASWTRIRRDCAGRIDSLVELLQGRFAQGVMQLMTARGTGLFPAPKEIRFDCSCPDVATMCKHVAASLYGVGARLDADPALLFTLRKVDHLDLIADAGRGPALPAAKRSGSRRLEGADLSGIFGIALDEAAPPGTPTPARGRGARRKPPKRATARKSKRVRR